MSLASPRVVGPVSKGHVRHLPREDHRDAQPLLVRWVAVVVVVLRRHFHHLKEVHLLRAVRRRHHLRPGVSDGP